MVCLPSFEAQFSLGGHVYSQAGCDGNLWCGCRFLPTNSLVKTKKRSSARNLRLRLAFTRVFRPGKRLYSRLSSIYFTLYSIYFTRLYSRLSSILGAEASKCTTVAPGLFRSFGHSARFEGTFFAWGAQAVIWGGHGPKIRGVGLSLGFTLFERRAEKLKIPISTVFGLM